MTALEIAMDKARLAQVQSSSLAKPVDSREVQPSEPGPLLPDTGEGMAQIFEDTPMSKPVAIVTVAFARKFCAEDPYYTWRKL